MDKDKQSPKEENSKQNDQHRGKNEDRFEKGQQGITPPKPDSWPDKGSGSESMNEGIEGWAPPQQ